MKRIYKRIEFMIIGALITCVASLIWLPDNSYAQKVLDQPHVRLVYFLPSDRPARPDRVEALRQLIKEAQEFYAEQMESHGFGRKTFKVETNKNGEPVVHHVDGKFAEDYYYEPLSDDKIWQEVYEQFDELQHIYFIAIDLSHEALNGGESCGLGGLGFLPVGGDAQFLIIPGKVAFRHRDETQGEQVIGGTGIIPASGHCFDETKYTHLHKIRVTVHELGHAFGLEHDFREGRDSDAAIGGRGFQLSKCDVEWLSVSRFFNNIPKSNDAPGEIKLLSKPTYSPSGIKLRFRVTDADGLHQAQLLVPENHEGTWWGPYRIFDCKQINGITSTIEFISPELIIEPVDRITLQIIDVNGSITWATFLTDIASVLPAPKVIKIPDKHLAAAIRTQLELAPTEAITDQAMRRLMTLEAEENQIKNLTGLEHATQLAELYLYKNQIRNLTPLAGLVKLSVLVLDENNIINLQPLTRLTQLEELFIGGNRIRNQGVQLIGKLTQLKALSLYGNQISNIKPLANLTNLEKLWMSNNRIRDVSPLAELINLKTLHLSGNLIQDTSPLANLKKLSDVDIEIRQQSVPTTGTWLAIDQPQSLTREEFIIKPAEFVVLAHRGKRGVTEATDFNNYFYIGKTSPQNAKNPDFPNLDRFFQNGGRIELVSNISQNPLPPSRNEPKFGDVVISEIMWGLNGSNPVKQYIELYNTSTHTYTFKDGDLSLRFSRVSEAPLPNQTFSPADNPNVEEKVIDRMSNKDWKMPGKSGNTSQNKPLISTYRAIDYSTGQTPDGTIASSWHPSTGRVNLSAPSYGTPGAKHLSAPLVVTAISQHPLMYWIDAEAGTLHRLVSGEVKNLDPMGQDANSLAVDVASNKIYWTEEMGVNRGKIKSANLDGSNVQVIATLNSVPRSIAVDPIRSKLYWTNSRGRIQRSNLKGKQIRNLIHNLKSPNNITIDVAGAKLYWTETGSIRCSNLNGKSIQDIATGLDPLSGIAISGNRLYSTEITGESSGKIGRMNLNGSNFGTLATLRSAPSNIVVDAVGRKLYWSDSDGNIQRANLIGKNIKRVVSGLAAVSDFALGSSSATTAAAPANGSLFETLTPDTTNLFMNYPNPFNPETWIPYQLAKPSDVKITIYDTRGVVVRKLELGHQPQGFYTDRSRAAYWDGRNALGERVASGIYFYQFEAESVSLTRKMLILK